MITLKGLRTSFLEYFKQHNHKVMPSGPLVPENDPTLLFVNAGMVPFKGGFTGAQHFDPPRLVSAQKCLRAGGKHNDLDNVGYTARHHTFFEMLGNFSIGDYFKDRAIELAWSFITGELALPVDRLLVTVYGEDEEARALWQKIAGLPEHRILGIQGSDNFWSMGETGPCGPCSEIFYDHGDHIPGGPPGSADEDGDRFVEIWNLVFMQYEMQAGGERLLLPKPSIDTGMGLERIAAVMQGVHDNYDIDLFRTLIEASVEASGVKAEGEARFSHRVIADHLRACSFLIAEGLSPSSEGRGYVLRRIMRRAMRHAYLLGTQEPLMHRLVPALIAEMGEAYPELIRASTFIEDTFLHEEERFRRTLGRGTALLDEAQAHLAPGESLSGETAFKLYDTYGFPLDLTEDALRAQGLSVDREGFEAAMAQQKTAARAHWSGSGDQGGEDFWRAVYEKTGPTCFTGYEESGDQSQVQAIVENGKLLEQAKAGQNIALVFEKTPFYAESGGQAGDHGIILFETGARLHVEDVQKQAGGLHVHYGKVETGCVKTGDVARLEIDTAWRTRTRAHHSATHLLHAALHEILGSQVTQKGQMVDGERIRFDFAFPRALKQEELEKLEARVNAVIRDDAASETRMMTPKDAVEHGAIALFGEKYGDVVRVLSLGHAPEESQEDKPYSLELCGGTHVDRAGEIGVFVLISESAVGAGIRRIEALAGQRAYQYFSARKGLVQKTADLLKVKPDDLSHRLEALLKERKSLIRELEATKKKLAMGGGGASPSEPETIGDTAFLGRLLEGVDGKALRGLVDEGKKQLGSGILAFVSVRDGKASLAVGVTEDLTPRFSAVDLVREGAKAIGGQGGGGRPDMAQAGGPRGEEASKALLAIRQKIETG